MTGMVIDYTWTILFGAAAVLSLRFSWSTAVRPISWALLGSIVFSNVVVANLPEGMIELEPAVFAVAELGVFITAMFCLVDSPKHAAAIMVLNLISCIVSVSYPPYRGNVGIEVYEEIVNTILGVECFIQVNVGLWRYVGDSIGRHRRHRHHRRSAQHALLRFRVASESRRDRD